MFPQHQHIGSGGSQVITLSSSALSRVIIPASNYSRQISVKEIEITIKTVRIIEDLRKFFFGSVLSTMHHFSEHVLPIFANAKLLMGLPRIQYLQREVARRTYRLTYLSDYDVAKKYVEKLNQNRIEYHTRLWEPLHQLKAKLGDLHQKAYHLNARINDQKQLDKQAKHVFKLAQRYCPILISDCSLPSDLLCSSIPLAKRVKEGLVHLTNEERVLNGKEVLLERQIHQFHEHQKSITLLKEKLTSPQYQNLPVSLKEMKVSPLLLWQAGHKFLIFSLEKLRIKINFFPSIHLCFDPTALPQTPQEQDQVIEQIAHALTLAPDALKKEIEVKGWQLFLEERILPTSKLDFQSQSVLEKLVKGKELPIDTLLQRTDVQDVVSLSPFKNPITLACGHTFSFASLHEQNNCPCCRAKIDYDRLTPNPFLSQVSLVFRKKRLVEKVRSIKIEESSLKQIQDDLGEIKGRKMKVQQERALFDNLLPIYPASQSDVDALSRQLEEVEREISMTQAAHDQMKEEYNAFQSLSKAKLNQMAQQLVASFHQGDLTATISMDLTRKEYEKELEQELNDAKKDLAAAEFVQLSCPNLDLLQLENIFDLGQKILAVVPEFNILSFFSEKEQEKLHLFNS